MDTAISIDCLFKCFKCFICFLLLAFLTMSPVYAGSGSEGDEASVTDKIRMHMETVGLTDTEIDEKLTQLKEKLTTGISFEDSCTQCHADVLRQGGKR